MVECIKTGKKPVYEVECYECHSLLRYARADVSLMHITCPVCGCSVMVSYNRVDDTEYTETEASEYECPHYQGVCGLDESIICFSKSNKNCDVLEASN